VQTGPTGRFDHEPAVDQAVVFEPFDPSLGDPSTGEEELFDLITIEVAVIR
jgi:hypothetical protein